MGHHTWFYDNKQPIKLREKVTEILNREVGIINGWNLQNKDKHTLLKQNRKNRNVVKRASIDKLKSILQYDVMSKHQCDFISHDGKYSYNYLDTPHDIFRVQDGEFIKPENFCIYDYFMDIELHSYRDTIVFLNKYKIHVDSKQLNEIRKYWSRYPHGLISFG